MSNKVIARGHLRLLALLAALIMVAAACSSDGESATNTDASNTETDGDGSSDGGDGSDDDNGDQSEGDDDAMDDSDDDPVEVSSGGSVDAFCTAWAEAEMESDEFVNFFDPVAFEEFVDRQIEMMEAVSPPDDIADDFNIVLNGQRMFRDMLAENNFDIASLTPEQEAVLDDPTIDAADDRLDDWGEANCPELAMLDDEETAAPDDVLEQQLEAMLSTESGRALIAEQIALSSGLTEEEAICFMESTGPDVLIPLAMGATGGEAFSAETLNAFTETLVTCNIDISKFEGLTG